MITAATARENTNGVVGDVKTKVLDNIYAAIEDHSKKGGYSFEFGVNGMDPSITEYVITDLTTNGFTVGTGTNIADIKVTW
jgi:hypothetical protein